MAVRHHTRNRRNVPPLHRGLDKLGPIEGKFAHILNCQRQSRKCVGDDWFIRTIFKEVGGYDLVQGY